MAPSPTGEASTRSSVLRVRLGPLFAGACKTTEWFRCGSKDGYETRQKVDQAKEALYFGDIARGLKGFNRIDL